jgi:hypothetical protein
MKSMNRQEALVLLCYKETIRCRIVGSEQESDGVHAGVSLAETNVRYTGRIETRRLDEDSGLAGVHGLPAGN